jgi:translation elongation factor EF-G
VYLRAEKATAFSTRSRARKAALARIVQMHANNREEVSEIRAGDIAACGLRRDHGETCVIRMRRMLKRRCSLSP